MKKTLPTGPIILIVTANEFRANSGETTPLAELFDVSTMVLALKKRVSSKIDLSDIEKAFAEQRNIPDQPLESISKIVFDQKETYLEKAFLLRNLFINSDTVSHPAAKHKIIRNLGYILFSKEKWFAQNFEFAQRIFPNQVFDEMFFKKRTDQVYLFMKKNPA